MLGTLFAPFTKFRKLNLTLHFLLILTRPIINALTGRAGQFYESILRHMENFVRETLYRRSPNKSNVQATDRRINTGN